MKLKRRAFICTILSVVFLFVSSLAQTAGISRQLADSGIVLLFETNNVTLSGAANFYLNGERFKSAEVTYKQAGTDSFWDLQLKTPREYRTDRETGFIIIANDENVYVMERYHPGIYSDGSVYPCETLIRRSTRSDILVAAARAVADQLEVLLPTGTFTVTDFPSGDQVISVKLAEGSVPALLNPFLNLAADFALRRYMGIEYDTQDETSRAYYADNAETITQRIVRTTTSFELGKADFSVTLDEKGRFSNAEGTAVFLLFADNQASIPLEIYFDLTASDYGSTAVEMFNPLYYDVIPAGSGPEKTDEVEPSVAERLTSRAKAVLAAGGYDPSEFTQPEVTTEDGLYYVTFPGWGDFDVVSTVLNEQGAFLQLGDGREQWYMSNAHEPSEAELSPESTALLHSFIREAFPELAEKCVSFCPTLEYSYDGGSWVYCTAQDKNNSDLPYSFYLRLTAPQKVVSFDCLTR